MIEPDLIAQIFTAAAMQRWNDHPRPVELTELDKQGHKMIIAWWLAQMERDVKGASIAWRDLVEGGLFEFFPRIILTDIKAPVFHRVRRTHGEKLYHLVADRLHGNLQSLSSDFCKRFETYAHEYLVAPRTDTLEKRILGAAHYLATNWEFKLIHHICPPLHGLERTRNEIESQIHEHRDLAGVQEIMRAGDAAAFVDMTGQLRFQVRWAQTPRIPRTSVLGHMFFVGVTSYIASLEIRACTGRAVNNFFAGLMHDLPEVLTRDIVSPVKTSISEAVINDIEKELLEERLWPLLPASMRTELEYLTCPGDEFANRIRPAGSMRVGIADEDMNATYNTDQYSPVDGRLVRACDHMAAFVEAVTSVGLGIHSPDLHDAIETLGRQYADFTYDGLAFGPLLAALGERAGRELPISRRGVEST